jgi:hypothetical protein
LNVIDVIAMSLAYYSRDIEVKSLALFLLSSTLLVRLRPWASAKKAYEPASGLQISGG